MKKIEYIPHPIDTKDVKLSDELNDLAETLAKNVHDVWAQGRIDEGWTYGKERNDELRKTPCLVAYEELPEEEKSYDRKTALETLRVIKKLGFEITKKNSTCVL